MIRVILISGRSGSGKTSVGNEIYHRLSQRGITHASIEGDNLDMMYPEQSTPEIFLANLRSCWENFMRMGNVRRLVLNGTAVILDHERIREAIGNVSRGVEVQVKGFVLECSDECIRRRLEKRETGTALEDHVERSERMAGVLKTIEGDWIKHVDTDGGGLGIWPRISLRGPAS